MMKKSVMIVIGLLGSAGANPYQPSYTYNEILVVNIPLELISDVTIKVEIIRGIVYLFTEN